MSKENRQAGPDQRVIGGSASPIETGGKIFDDGTSIELVADPQTSGLSLLLTNGQTQRIATRVEFRGRVYVPINLEASTLRAVRFPNRPSDHISTTELFASIRELFAECGFGEGIAHLGTHFVFSAWFPDCLPVAPCLLVTGPRPEADLFFQLLASLVRHPLQLADFNLNGLSPLIEIQPTLLVHQELLGGSKVKLLLAMNKPNAYVPMRGGLASFYSVKAIYQGTACNEEVNHATLRINLMPLRGKFPILVSKAQEQIARKFQSMLLNYRVRNIAKVRESSFDFPWLSSGVRVLARILGVCVPDAPELQADLIPWLQHQQQIIREHNWLDDRWVAIEAALAFCHRNQKDHRVFVGEFAETASTILEGRGLSKKLLPKEMGLILRSLGFFPRRGAQGYSIHLKEDVRRLIHKLALDFDVATIQDGKARCPYCREILEGHVTPEARQNRRRVGI